MSNIKFHYNPKTFQYERARITFRDVLWYVSGVLFTGLLFCGALITAHDLLFESETERVLRQENTVLEKHKSILEQQLSAITVTLTGLKEEDKILYARLFNSNPPESSSAGTTISKEQVLLADPSEFRNLLVLLESKSELLRVKSTNSNANFANNIQISKAQLGEIGSIPSIQPIANAELDLLVSGYGERINPFHKGKYTHPGLDFAAPRGTHVVATAPGRVISTNRTNLQAGYGNYIDVDHGNGFVTRYAHLEEIKVSRGQKVAKGKVIGFVGNSGGSVAPHLHYEVIRDGEQVNPLHYLMEGLSGKDYSALSKLSVKQNQSLD